MAQKTGRKRKILQEEKRMSEGSVKFRSLLHTPDS